MKFLLWVFFLALFAWPLAAQQAPASNVYSALSYRLTASPSPVAPTGLLYRQFGTAGATSTRYYWVSAVYPQGETRFIGPLRPLTGPAALTAADYFRVAWSPATQALSYNVVRTTSAVYPASGNILVCSTTANLCDDQGVRSRPMSCQPLIRPWSMAWTHWPESPALPTSKMCALLTAFQAATPARKSTPPMPI